MKVDNLTLEGVQLRRKVDKLVLADFDRAYIVAKSIRHPWYRCQSLAKISEYASGTSVRTLLNESFESAMNCHDENRRVSVACWPIKVAINLNETSLAEKFLDDCIRQLKKDDDPISRWCAVSVVNTIKYDTHLLGHFYNTFELVTSRGHGWRVERSINQLLSDPLVQKDQRYSLYLTERLAAINNWKANNAKIS